MDHRLDSMGLDASAQAAVSTAVGQIIQVVQQDAALVEESPAATHAMKAETRNSTC